MEIWLLVLLSCGRERKGGHSVLVRKEKARMKEEWDDGSWPSGRLRCCFYLSRARANTGRFI